MMRTMTEALPRSVLPTETAPGSASRPELANELIREHPAEENGAGRLGRKLSPDRLDDVPQLGTPRRGAHAPLTADRAETRRVRGFPAGPRRG